MGGKLVTHQAMAVPITTAKTTPKCQRLISFRIINALTNISPVKKRPQGNGMITHQVGNDPGKDKNARQNSQEKAC